MTLGFPRLPAAEGGHQNVTQCMSRFLTKSIEHHRNQTQLIVNKDIISMTCNLLTQVSRPDTMLKDPMRLKIAGVIAVAAVLGAVGAQPA